MVGGQMNIRAYSPMYFRIAAPHGVVQKLKKVQKSFFFVL